MISDINTINDAENAIDAEFNNCALKESGYAQAVWTLLSVNEDAFLKCLTKFPDTLPVFADVRLNALSYPLRSCHKERCLQTSSFKREYISSQYKLAWDWLKTSEDYTDFNSIFPFIRRTLTSVTIDGSHILASWSQFGGNYYFAHEAYNRLKSDWMPNEYPRLKPSDKLWDMLAAASSVKGNTFKIKFNPSLAQTLTRFWLELTDFRYNLPNNWQFNCFSIEEFKKVFVTLQGLLWAWHSVRLNLAANGLVGLGYTSSVWVVKKEELLLRLHRYTRVNFNTLKILVEYLTFGAKNIREPDIALQPIIDLGNEHYALSPFVFLSSSGERNLCALLNMIPEERRNYSIISNEKESCMRDRIIQKIKCYAWDTITITLNDTNIDLAIIDRVNKVCLCTELKWFIAPAEIRECLERNKELLKGIEQCVKINNQFQNKNNEIIQRLNITSDYVFFSCVVSENWIGGDDIQNVSIPIINLQHLLNHLTQNQSLHTTIEWLKKRSYLPKIDIDYTIHETTRKCGKWTADWYGIEIKP